MTTSNRCLAATAHRAKAGVRVFDGRAFSASMGCIRLRLVAYTPARVPVPEGHVRVVVQVVVDDAPIAEDPIHIETMPAEAFDLALALSVAEGWVIRPWPSPVEEEAVPPQAKPHFRHHAA